MRIFLHFTAIAALVLLFSNQSIAQQPTIDRVDPPFWWNEMGTKDLQLLIKGENIAKARVNIDQQGIEIVKTTPMTNPNYLVLDLKVNPEVPPGSFTMEFSVGRQRTKYEYEIKQRAAGGESSGLQQSDLIYLLMPDRFANGDPGNDKIAGMNDQSLNRDSMFHRHGGDIKGILDNLDYLQELGITALWINPLLENDQPEESYHGYAATDHYKIDRRYGSNELYRKLVKACHDREMKVIMDIVFNHVGNEHYLIKEPPAADWVHQWDEFTKTNYRATTLMDPYASEYDRKLMTDGWFDTHMPDLNQQNPYVAKYLIQNSMWWIEVSGIDGFRVDTYAYSDRKFMADWGKAIREQYPRTAIFGETWVHGTPVQAWFTENQDLDGSFETNLPGVTDFQLYYALNEALTGKFGWTEGVSRLYYTLAKDFIYEDPTRNVIFLDNHDISRYYSMIGEDLRKFKMGVAFLMTTRGIPMLYYGTEILMKNFADPDGKVREDFPGGWKGDATNKFDKAGRTAQEQEAFEYVKTLANWRKNSPSIINSKLMQFTPEDGVYTYFRYPESGRGSLMVIMNSNETEKVISTERFKERIGENTGGKDVVTGKKISLTKEVKVPAMTTLVIEVGR